MARSIWPNASSARVARSLSAHSVTGLIISAVLFIICLSGTLAVFEDEIGWWELPETPAVSFVTPEAAQKGSEAAFAKDPETTHLYLYLPRENWPRFVVATDNGTHSANADGELVGEYESAWNDFLIHMHYYLHLPETFGMIIVAIFGVFLVGMAISGFLAHPKVFKDAFRLKRQGQRRIVQADLHNRLSVWTAPFHIIVAATGAMIGLFVVIAFVLAQTGYGGDTRALTQAIFGSEPEVNETPADLPNIAGALSYMQTELADKPAFLVVVHDPGKASQHIGMYGEHMDRLIYGETYEFDAAGSLTGHEGNSDGEAGIQIANSVYRLHFGDFGGTPMKIAYFVLGLLLCVIIATGMNIYFLKKDEAGHGRPRWEASWSGVVWGSCFLLAATLPLAILGLPSASLTAIFWIGLVVVTLVSALFGQEGRAGKVLRGLTGLSLVLAALIHAVKYAGTYGNPYILAVTLGFALTGVFLLVQAARHIKPVSLQKTASDTV